MGLQSLNIALSLHYQPGIIENKHQKLLRTSHRYLFCSSHSNNRNRNITINSVDLRPISSCWDLTIVIFTIIYVYRSLFQKKNSHQTPTTISIIWLIANEDKYIMPNVYSHTNAKSLEWKTFYDYVIYNFCIHTYGKYPFIDVYEFPNIISTDISALVATSAHSQLKYLFPCIDYQLTSGWLKSMTYNMLDMWVI